MCPGSRKNLSRDNQDLSSKSVIKYFDYSTLIKSAPPIAPLGCPDLAFSTIAAVKMRMLSAALSNILLAILNFYKVLSFNNNESTIKVYHAQEKAH